MRIAVMFGTLAGLVALGTACEDGGAGTVAAGEDCPQAGYVVPSNASLLVSALALDGLPLITGFDSTASYDGQPAACFDEATHTARLEITLDNEPFGVITVGGTQEGSFDLNGGEATLSVEVTNDDGSVVTFNAGNWQTGSGFINSLAPLDVDVSASGVQSNGQFLEISFTANVGL